MDNPIVSVVVSVYNSERFLAAAIESMLKQTFSELESIIVNDGSTDGSPAILDYYQGKDKRIRVRHQPNRGLIAALNCGIALA